jgi:hypothetical protein
LQATVGDLQKKLEAAQSGGDDSLWGRIADGVATVTVIGSILF